MLVDLLEHQQNSVRLTAANALGAIGEAARPAIPEIRAALKDSQRYVNRVSTYTLKHLNVEP